MNFLKYIPLVLCLWTLAPDPAQADSGLETVAATDRDLVKRSGKWNESRFRFAMTASLQTNEDGAALEFDFDGTAIAVRLGGHDVPAYGPPSLGRLAIAIDGEHRLDVSPRSSPREIVLATGLHPGRHTVRIEHQRDGDLTGCRVESFRVWKDGRGGVRFHVGGEQNSHLVDCRAVIRRGDRIIREELVRNWITGQCSLNGLLPADNYSLEIRAMGWLPVRTRQFHIVAEDAVEIPAIYLRRDPATVRHRFRFPRLNQPVVRRPGETFRARFLGFDANIDEVKVTRKIGPAVISRVLSFEEDKAAAYYYDREVSLTLPGDMPSGTYDLTVTVTGGGRTGVCRSPRSVHVVTEYPANPMFVTFGHLDTSAQYQAEYLAQLVEMINVLAPDMVLCSNACNPAYVSGALASLDMPYVINFGNHQFPGHEAWYGDPVGVVDFGPNVAVLNFGYPWHVDRSKADALLGAYADTAIRVINAFEANAPIAFLDRHQIRMIHDAHGIGRKVMDLGSTPTKRIGKSNSESFRVVRFRDNRVVSCTYRGDDTAPIPFPRHSPPPLALSFDHPNDGSHTVNAVTVTNRLAEAFPDGRVRFVLPSGEYDIRGGRPESNDISDDGHLSVLTVRVDIPPNGTAIVTVKPSHLTERESF